MHHRTKLHQTGQTVVEISRLTVFKMAAIHHLGFLEI